MKLEIQKFLETHSLDDLKSIGIDYRKSDRNTKKMSLNYNQITCDPKDPRTKECRGLILRTDRVVDPSEIVGETKILAFPFRRFFNSDDPNADAIEWTRAKYYNKLDGTLAIVYFDTDLRRFCVATRSVPDANVPFDEEGQTYEDLFNRTWNKQMFGVGPSSLFLGELLNRGFTYMFELCTPENQHVVRQKDYSLTLLGFRNAEMIELPLTSFYSYHVHEDHFMMTNPPAPARNYGQIERIKLCPTVKTNSREYQSWVENLGLDEEGLVICDSNFNRIKCKSPAYRAAHRLKDKASSSSRNLLELILLQKDDDVRSVLAEDMIKKLDDMKQGLQELIFSQDLEFENAPKETRKEFAIHIQRGSLWMGPQMWRFANPTKSFLDWVESQKKNGEFPDSFLDSVLLNIKKKGN
jgi:hypothetical protein